MASRETLEPTTGLEDRLPQLNIVGSNDTKEKDAEKPRTGPMIVEISEDGAYELPEDSDANGDGGGGGGDDGEPPSLEDSLDPSYQSAVQKDKESDGPTLMDEMLAAANVARDAKKGKAAAEQKRVKKEFGKGLKGGFFNKPKGNKPSKREAAGKKSSSTGKKSIETLKPKEPGKKKADPLVLDDVQEAMSASRAPMREMLEKGEWVTPELMQQFAQNPVLARGLNNPRMQQFIAALQKNPKAAMEAVKNDPEAEAFMNEFCKTVGSHFTDLGTQQNQPNNVNAPPPSAGPLADETVKRLGTKDKSPPAAPTPEEDAQVQNVLQNENLRNLLMDQELQKVLMTCQQPGKLGEYMRHEKWGPKLRILADNGLIRIER